MLNLVTAGTPSCFAFFVRLRGFVIQTLSASRRTGSPVKKHLQHAVFLVIVACLMICAYGRIEYDQYPYSGWDLAAYRAMAAAAPQLNPIVSSPFAYRLFGPYVEKGWTPSKIKLIIAASAPALVVFASLRLLIDASGYSLTQALFTLTPPNFFPVRPGSGCWSIRSSH